MANWRALLTRTRAWLAADGLLFIHVFTHASAPYRFDHRDKSDWIAQHFFTGGIMPSRTLMHQFERSLRRRRNLGLERRALCADRPRLAGQLRCAPNGAIERVSSPSVYGRDAKLWLRRWRLFYMATEGLFGHAGGDTWGVTHYRLTPAG